MMLNEFLKNQKGRVSSSEDSEITFARVGIAGPCFKVLSHAVHPSKLGSRVCAGLCSGLDTAVTQIGTLAPISVFTPAAVYR